MHVQYFLFKLKPLEVLSADLGPATHVSQQCSSSRSMIWVWSSEMR